MRRWAGAAMTVLLATTAVIAAMCGPLGASLASASPRGHTRRRTRSTCGNSTLRPTPSNTSRIAAATLCLIEHEREALNLRLLRPNGYLQQIATGQATAMVVGNYFDDNGLSGATPWQRITASPYASGARGLAIAQNIGWGTESLATPAAMVSAWMHSPPHREIVLTAAFRDVGVGVAAATPPSLASGAPGATYTVEFAARG